MAIRRRGSRWQVDAYQLTAGGERVRVRRSLPPGTTLRQAREVERQVLLGGLFSENKSTDLTVGEYAAQWLARQVGIAPATLTSYRTHVGYLARTTLAGRPIACVDFAALSDYFAKLNLAESTKHVHRRVLRSIFIDAYKRKEIRDLPDFPKIKVDHTLPRYLSYDEADRLIRWARQKCPYWHTGVLLGVRAGLRLGEIMGLRWRDVDLTHGLIHITRQMTRTGEAPVKGRRSRGVPMADSVRVALAALPAPHRGRVWASVPHVSTVQTTFSAAAERLVGWRVTWHTLRHTFASHLAQRGVSPWVLQRYLGHTSLTTTLRYAHLAPDTGASDIIALDFPPTQ